MCCRIRQTSSTVHTSQTNNKDISTMKLLRSTFLAFYLTTTTTSNVSAFTPQISKSSSLAATTRHHNHNHPCSANKLSQSSSTSLSAFLHEQPASQISDEEIQKERQFLQVVREVNMAKEYMDWLIEESGDGGGGAAAAAAEESTEESTPVAAETSAANDIELFGGGGDANPSSTTEEKQTVYQPSLRSDLGSTILLSGTVDATLLSILNNNFFGQDNVPNFNFSTIKALVKDVALTKKRAISREARYGGLLDKLVIQEATNDSSSVLPTPEELGGVTSWIVQLSLGDDTSDNLTQIAKLAQGSNELTNVVVLVDGMASTKNIVEGWETVMDVSDHGSAFKCTLLAIGELHDGGNDGGYYHVGALEGGGGGTASPDTIDAPKLSKKKAYQLVAHALALDSTANASLMAYEYPTVALQAVVSPYAEDDYAIRDEEGNEKVDEYKDIKMEGRMIQAMRELGFTQYSELDVLVGKGIEVSLIFMICDCFFDVATIVYPDLHL